MIFLIKYFPDLFDYSFTATMEDELDEVSREKEPGGRQSKFYQPLESKLALTEQSAEHVQLPVETVDKMCPECGKQLIVRTGKLVNF